jgi:hypothetical protein
MAGKYPIQRLNHARHAQRPSRKKAHLAVRGSTAPTEILFGPIVGACTFVTTSEPGKPHPRLGFCNALAFRFPTVFAQRSHLPRLRARRLAIPRSAYRANIRARSFAFVLALYRLRRLAVANQDGPATRAGKGRTALMLFQISARNAPTRGRGAFMAIRVPRGVEPRSVAMVDGSSDRRFALYRTVPRQRLTGAL